MSNNYFKFKQFTVFQGNSAMKVGVDSVLLGAWTNPKEATTILDIGTGTGLLSLMIAQKSNANITAIEIDKDSYLQADENVNKSPWANKIKLQNISFQNYIKLHKNWFDLIVCNPPYFIDSFKSPKKNRNIARHNDTLSLNELFFGSKTLLSENGRLCLIYPYDQKDNLFILAEKNKLYPSEILKIHGNEYKRPNRIIVEFNHLKNEIVNRNIYIRDSKENDYSAEYKEITKDYYLAF